MHLSFRFYLFNKTHLQAKHNLFYLKIATIYYVSGKKMAGIFSPP